MTNWTKIRTQLGNRSAIVGVGVAGFLVGAGGFAAAQSDDSPSARVDAEIEAEVETETEVETERTAAGSSTEVTAASKTAAGVTVPVVTIDDTPSTTADVTVPVVTIDETPSTSSTSVPTTIDDHGDDDSTSTSTSSTSVPTTIDDHGDDDSTSTSSSSTSVPTTIDDHGDDDSTSTSSTSVPVALPGAFTRSYQSFGGSIEVTWTGTAFVLESVSPAPGFRAEIEDQAWDRIRVDFEGDADARIEVRLNDGRIRVRVD